MSRQLRNYVGGLLLLLLCSCLPPSQMADSAAPPPTEPPLTYTPTESSSSLFNNISPSNSLESGTLPLSSPLLSNVHLLDAKGKAKYDELKKEYAATEARISELDNMRRGADIDIIQALSSGGAKMAGGSPSELGFGDTQSNYEDPHIFIQNKQWEREFAVNEIVEKQRELGRINAKMDQVLEEAAMSCFPASTAILMDGGGIKPIAEIKIGDMVMVYDIATDTMAAAPVKELYNDDNNHYYTLNAEVKATAYERFLTRQGWRKIRDLSLQDEIFNGNAFEKVSSLDKTATNLKVYNMRIETAHNFFVSGDGQNFLLVHNSGGGGGGGK
jgi:hypothetical protein